MLIFACSYLANNFFFPLFYLHGLDTMSAFKEVGESKRFSLSKEVLDLAQHAIMLVPCEWEGCQIVLNSWQALLKVNVTIHQS